MICIRTSSFVLVAICLFVAVRSDSCVRPAATVPMWSQSGQSFYLDPAFDLDFKFSSRNVGATPLGGLGYSYLKGGCVAGRYLNGTVDFGAFESTTRADGYSKVEGKIIVEADDGTFVGLDFSGLEAAAPTPTDYFVVGVKIRAPENPNYGYLNRLMFLGRVLPSKNGDDGDSFKWILRVFAIKDVPVGTPTASSAGFVAPSVPFHFNLYSSGNGSVAKFWQINDLLDGKPIYGQFVSGKLNNNQVLLPGVAGDFLTLRADNYYEPNTIYISADNSTGVPQPLVVYETTGVVGNITTRSYYYQVSTLYANPAGPSGGVVKKRFMTKGRLGAILGPTGPIPWLFMEHYSIEVV